MKAPDSIQAIPEVQRTFFIFSSTCRRAEHIEQLKTVEANMDCVDTNHGIELQNEHEEENESAAAYAEWAVYFINLYPQKPRDRRYHDATKEGY